MSDRVVLPNAGFPRRSLTCGISRVELLITLALVGGRTSYLSEKFIYTISSYQPDDDEDSPYTPDSGFEKLPYMK